MESSAGHSDIVVGLSTAKKWAKKNPAFSGAKKAKKPCKKQGEV
jgi:hypothetical protein